MVIKIAKFGFNTLIASSSKLRVSKVSSELCDLESFPASLKDGVAHHLA